MTGVQDENDANVLRLIEQGRMPALTAPIVAAALARAWDEGWQAGYDDYDQGTETPNPHRALPPVRS